ncbi:MAG: porin family protein [Elusimicrobia bacterium]|nr:porin family protein [Elusimicrobiota bacterium]
MKKVIIALMVLGVCGTSVFAGEMQKEGSLLLGYAMPGGDVGDTVDGGIAFGFDYDGYKLNDMWSIGGTFLYTSSPEKTIDSVDYTLSTWGLTPYAKYSKEIDLGGKKATVFGLAGLGLYGVTAEATAGSVSVEASDSEFGFNLGGGIMFPMGDKMKLGADLRYHLVASDLSYFIPAVKFTYSF